MIKNNNYPLPSELLSTTPLYRSLDLSSLDDDEERGYLESVMHPEHPIDAYCTSCECQSTFYSFFVKPIASLKEHDELIDDNYFGAELRCARDNEHRIIVFFRYTNRKLVKIGQFPSIADLSVASTLQYKKLLGVEKYKELNKAIGLKSHGIGVGSFVYLRRIFELLIEQAHLEAQRQTREWNEELFQRSRMDDKIQILKEFLPDSLVDNRSIYSILSAGIHSLSEDECLSHFEVILLGIELILDEKLEEERKKKKLADVKQAIEVTKGKVKSIR